MTAAVGSVESTQRAASCPQAPFLQDLPAQPQCKQAGTDQSRHLLIPRSIVPLSTKLLKASSLQHHCRGYPGGWGAARMPWAFMVQNTGIESRSRGRDVLGEKQLERGKPCNSGGHKTYPEQTRCQYCWWGDSNNCPHPCLLWVGTGGDQGTSLCPSALISCTQLRLADGSSSLPSLCVVISGQGKMKPSAGVWYVNNYN